MSAGEGPRMAADRDLVFADWDAVTERVMSMMNAHLPIPNGTLLDATCGTGMACDAAVRLGWNVIGADASPALLERARERLPGVDFAVADVRRLYDGVQQSVDAEISIGDGLPALPAADLAAAVDGMRRCTRLGGATMIAVRDFPALKSAVWRDDPVCRVTALFVTRSQRRDRLHAPGRGRRWPAHPDAPPASRVGARAAGGDGGVRFPRPADGEDAWASGVVRRGGVTFREPGGPGLRRARGRPRDAPVDALPSRDRGGPARHGAARPEGGRAPRPDRLPVRGAVRPGIPGPGAVAGAARRVLRPPGRALPLGPARRHGRRARGGARDPVLASRQRPCALAHGRPARDDRGAARAAPRAAARTAPGLLGDSTPAGSTRSTPPPACWSRRRAS